jgi:hypothetical protein
MGNNNSNMFENPEVIMINMPQSTPVPMIPSDSEVVNNHNQYYNVDKVFIISYSYPDGGVLPSLDDSKTASDIGKEIPGGTAVILQNVWNKRNPRSLVTVIDAKSNDLESKLEQVTLLSRILIIGDIGEQSTSIQNDQDITEPILFGSSARHTVTDISKLLSNTLNKINLRTSVLDCLSLSLYYNGSCSLFVVKLMNELARKNAHVCIRATRRISPFKCVFYFHKLALRQLTECPSTKENV